MGQPRLKWGQVERFVRRRGCEIRTRGGDKIIVLPPGSPSGTRTTIRIGHTSCRNAGCELLKVYGGQICRLFDVTIDQIQNG
jgi:hypothetical protein